MAVKLNLLPQEYTLSGPVARVIKIARPLNIILLSIFLASSLGVAGYFIFSSITLGNLNTANTSYKNQIKAQQAAQQQIVLLKDRLGKIKQVFAKPDTAPNLLAIASIVNSVSGNASVTELDADSQKASLTVAFKNNYELSNFMNLINSQTAFSTISMDTFNYSPKTGYSVAFSFNKK